MHRREFICQARLGALGGFLAITSSGKVDAAATSRASQFARAEPVPSGTCGAHSSLSHFVGMARPIDCPATWSSMNLQAPHEF